MQRLPLYLLAAFGLLASAAPAQAPKILILGNPGAYGGNNGDPSDFVKDAILYFE